MPAGLPGFSSWFFLLRFFFFGTSCLWQYINKMYVLSEWHIRSILWIICLFILHFLLCRFAIVYVYLVFFVLPGFMFYHVLHEFPVCRCSFIAQQKMRRFSKTPHHHVAHLGAKNHGLVIFCPVRGSNALYWKAGISFLRFLVWTFSLHNYLIKHSIVLFFYLCLCLFKCYFIIYE